MRWDTWEELLLGGAVLRYGTGDWNIVAAELRAHTHNSPGFFTPQVCKAKYEDLQQRYSGREGWFEELRKKRMAELRNALELSDDSIGSLESKIETLMAETRDDCRVDCDSSRTVSLEPCQKSQGVECTSKDASRDVSSAGSFTHQTQTNWSPESQLPTSKASLEVAIKLEGLVPKKERDFHMDKQAKTVFGLQAPSVKGRRGARKRKDCSKDMKEASVGERYLLGSADVLSASRGKEVSTHNFGQIARSYGAEGRSQSRRKDALDDLIRMYNSVVQNECALVFRWRLDSQKRGRYKKLVRRHMDFNTIKSRITGGSVSTTKELLRDLLLVASNALVFYSKNTREHKAGARLRDIVTKSLMHQLGSDCKRLDASAFSSSTPMCRPPAKPRGIQAAEKPDATRRTVCAGSPPSMESLTVMMKGCAGPRVVASGRSELMSRGRKRTRLR